MSTNKRKRDQAGAAPSVNVQAAARPVPTEKSKNAPSSTGNASVAKPSAAKANGASSGQQHKAQNGPSKVVPAVGGKRDRSPSATEAKGAPPAKKPNLPSKPQQPQSKGVTQTKPNAGIVCNWSTAVSAFVNLINRGRSHVGFPLWRSLSGIRSEDIRRWHTVEEEQAPYQAAIRTG